MEEPEIIPGATLTLCQQVKALLAYHRTCMEHYGAGGDGERANRHRAFVKTCEALELKVCKREKAIPVDIPHISEVLFLASEISLPDREARKFYHHFDSKKWKMGHAQKKMENWQARLRLWKENWQEREEKEARQSAKGGRKIADGEQHYKEQSEMPDLLP